MKVSRTFISFFIFGLINNVLYVVILTAAHDLVSPTTPKSLILLADILPAFLLKLSLPLFVNDTSIKNDNGKIGLGINYRLRLALIVSLSSVGIILTSLTFSLYVILTGVILASLSSGLGETTFLQLTHYHNHSGTSKTSEYSNIAIHGWSCGTGGAGLLGAGLVLLLTTILNIHISWVLRSCSLFPFVHLWVYFRFLPSPTLTFTSSVSVTGGDYQLINDENNDNDNYNDNIFNNFNENQIISSMEYENVVDDLISPNNKGEFISSILPKIQKYFLVYMMPLLLVYFAEYCINQGVAPTLLFPLDETPFKKFRDSYVTYGTIYQVGVFISRSSGSVIRLKNLYVLGLLQIINLILCILQSLYMFVPNIWIIFILILYEGLLGGSAYLNTFISVSEEVSVQDREFALGCVGISDSFGIVLAACISLWIEPTLCSYQVNTGRDWCTLK